MIELLVFDVKGEERLLIDFTNRVLRITREKTFIIYMNFPVLRKEKIRKVEASASRIKHDHRKSSFMFMAFGREGRRC